LIRLSPKYPGYAADEYYLHKNNFLACLEKNVTHSRDPGGALCSQDLWDDRAPMLP